MLKVNQKFRFNSKFGKIHLESRTWKISGNGNYDAKEKKMCTENVKTILEGS